MMIKFAVTEVFNAWIDVIDLAVNSDNYLIMPLNKKIACRNCGGVHTIKMKGNYISFLCKCGCRVYYPPNDEGVVITKFISKEDYEAGKNGRK